MSIRLCFLRLSAGEREGRGRGEREKVTQKLTKDS